MLSRVADSLYWMSRYLERAENTLRQIDVTMSLMLDPGGATSETRWRRLVAALGSPPGLEWDWNMESMARTLIFDRGNRASVIYCVNAARENARQVREEISTEQWQRLNRLFHHIRSPTAEKHFAANMNDALASILDGIHLFKGVTDTTMIHGQGWEFMRLGRYLERAYATATLLEVHEGGLDMRERDGTGQRYLEQVGLLRCVTAFEAYCQVYTADLTDARILEFLLLNRQFPHSIRYAIEGVHHAIQAIHAMSGRKPPMDLLATVGRVNAMLGYTTVGEVLASGEAAFLHRIRQQCMAIHEQIYGYYVKYSIQSALTA
jgi:uncharacterized alpha-E superfamily protein